MGLPVNITNEYLASVARGQIEGHSLIHKFGFATVGTSLTPVSTALVYKTPTAATALEFVSDNVNDTAAGTGAQEITVVGDDSSWGEITRTFETNGTTAVPLPSDLTRLTRWYVSRSGTYATATNGSHAGILTIRESGGGATWSTIGDSPLPSGQSEIGAYTLPKGYKGYLLSKSVFADTGKTINAIFFQRPDADQAINTNGGALRIVQREVGISGPVVTQYKAPKGPFVGPCDIGFMAKVSTTGTADVSVEFELLLIKDGY